MKLCRRAERFEVALSGAEFDTAQAGARDDVGTCIRDEFEDACEGFGDDVT